MAVLHRLYCKINTELSGTFGSLLDLGFESQYIVGPNIGLNFLQRLSAEGMIS